MANSRNLTATEEQVIIEHILELVTRGFPLRLAAVTDIANSLRAKRYCYDPCRRSGTVAKRSSDHLKPSVES